MRRRLLMIGACAMIVASCQPAVAPEMTEEEKARVIDAVEARVLGYFEAAGRQDAEWIIDFYADVDGCAIVGDGDLVGFDENAEALRTLFPQVDTLLHIEKRNEHVYVLAPDAATYSMEGEHSTVYKSGDTVNVSFAWTHVFKKLDGEWKVVQSAGTHIID